MTTISIYSKNINGNTINTYIQRTPDHPPQLYYCPNYYQLLVQVIEKSCHLGATQISHLLIWVDYSHPIVIEIDVKTSG